MIALPEPNYKRAIREEREHAERLNHFEVKRLRWHLADHPGQTLHQIGEALRRPGEVLLLDPWLRRLRSLVEAGEVRAVPGLDAVARFIPSRRVLTVDEMVALGLARPEPALPPAPMLPAVVPAARTGRYSDALFAKVIDRLDRLENLFGPTEADEVARVLRLPTRHIFRILVEAEALGCVRSARTPRGDLVWSLA